MITTAEQVPEIKKSHKQMQDPLIEGHYREFQGHASPVAGHW